MRHHFNILIWRNLIKIIKLYQMWFLIVKDWGMNRCVDPTKLDKIWYGATILNSLRFGKEPPRLPLMRGVPIYQRELNLFLFFYDSHNLEAFYITDWGWGKFAKGVRNGGQYRIFFKIDSATPSPSNTSHIWYSPYNIVWSKLNDFYRSAFIHTKSVINLDMKNKLFMGTFELKWN